MRIEFSPRQGGGPLDDALEPLGSQYDGDELDRAAALLRDAIDRIGREFFPEQYADGRPVR